MPKPELACIVINARTCHKRTNNSWILSRILRDFDVWRHPDCDRIEAEKLTELQAKEDLLAKEQKRAPRTKRIALRVTVWDCKVTSARGTGDPVYWAGLCVSAIQLIIAAIPWAIWDERFTFLVTAIGTVLAYASGALPQWVEEKFGVRKTCLNNPAKDRKAVFLTEGNGSHEAILILSQHGSLDLEALAGPQRAINNPGATRVCSVLLATLWLALLISVAGWDQHTWFLLGVGLLGLIHNAAVCAFRRRPPAFGLELDYQQTIVEGSVMEVLHKVETKFPQAGAALLDEFFSGDLRPREELIWKYSRQRYEDWYRSGCLMRSDGMPNARDMPSLQRAVGAVDDSDVQSLQVSPLERD
jgi:hypothetical protein